MAFQGYLLLGLHLLLLGTNSIAVTVPSLDAALLNRSSFPVGFIFGTASASYQYEGAANEAGRGPSIWDTYTHRYPGKIADGSNGDVAVDQYHRYKMEDVNYERDGIRCIQVLHLVVQSVAKNDFRDYAELCFKEFGDRVKRWITLNEPWSYSSGGYASGMLAPGRCSSWQNLNCTGGDSATEPYLVSHYQLLAHAAAVEVYKQKYQAAQKGVIGITLISHWFVPVSDAKHNHNALYVPLISCLDAERRGILIGPPAASSWLYVYPRGIRDLLLYTKEKYHNPLIYITENAYAPQLNTGNKSYLTDALVNETSCVILALCLSSRNSRSVALYKEKYHNPLIYITENGIDEFNNATLTLEEALIDNQRIEYYHSHLWYLRKAMKAHWSPYPPGLSSSQMPIRFSRQHDSSGCANLMNPDVGSSSAVLLRQHLDIFSPLRFLD
ncbi:Beta-glucosidase 12 [Morella rubra]|uniref:Beta-glucosidase 12 n=1 Tax=Morella rubra TaxID=262757 RepID=A0A6A1WY93_9ROSI|nr:Beta-glucosidase 12 [Morella rubra]